MPDYTMSEGYRIYDELTLSSAHNLTDTQTELTKRRMITEFWNRFAPELERFGPTGNIVYGDRVNVGYGYIVEGLARLSEKLPQNTPTGETVARTLIVKLQDAGFRCPDLLRVRLRGNAVTILGMAEVKSSVAAFTRKPLQTLFQEEDLRRMLRVLQEEKRLGDDGSFSRKKIRIALPFQKFLVLPLGVSEELTRRLPSGWKKLGLELTTDELVFIGKKLWPKFRLDLAFQPNERAEFDEQFMGWLEERARTIFHGVFQDLSSAEVRDLAFFVLATKKLPAHDALLRFILEKIAAMGSCLPLPMAGLAESGLTDEERQKFAKVVRIYRGPEKHVLYFLALLRDFTARLSPWLQERKVKRWFRSLKTSDGRKMEITVPLDILDL